MNETLPRLLLLTDRTQLPAGRGLVETVARCAGAGLQAVVLRELDLAVPLRAVLVDRLARHVRVIGAHRVLPGAAGVHLASAQPLTEAAGAPLHGRSCHDSDGVRRAAADGAAYVTISPVAPSASKPGYGPALGVEGVTSAVAAAGGTAVYALGGVGADNAAALRAAGAHGVTVMGAVMRAEDPAAVVTALNRELV